MQHQSIPVISALLGLLLLSAPPAEAAGVAPQPSICNRGCWGSRTTASGPFGWNSTWNRAVIHHTANSGDFNVSSITDSKARVRGTQNYHMDVLGWSDIGYHFLVDKFGNKFEGLNGSMGTSYPRGAHDGINNNSMGISMLGWFDSGYNGTPPVAMRYAVYDVIAWRLPNPFTGFGSSAYGGYSNVGYVCGHYNVSTKTCPGTQMQGYIGTNFSGGEARLEINKRITGAPWHATYVSNTFPAQVTAGQYVTCSVTFKNTGTNNWDTTNTKLGTSNPRDRSSVFYNSADWNGPNRPTRVDAATGVNQNGTFTFIAKAPSTAGSYQEYFELVQENVAWFQGDGVIWYVTVVTPSPTPSPSPSPSPSPTPTLTPSPSPSPTPTQDFIMDNTSASITYTGSWSTGTTAAGKYGSDYRYANSGSGAEAKYHFTGLTGGTYRVQVWYPAGTNRANNAPHRVDHYSGATTYYVNQQINGGQWVTLGQHYFGTQGYVVVRTTGANPTVVMADAVRLTWVAP